MGPAERSQITADAAAAGERADDLPPARPSPPLLTLREQLTRATESTFQCPGEPQPISRAVHLSRLANAYAKCRSCPQHPGAAAGLDEGEVALPSGMTAGRPLDLFTTNGIRGVYLSQLARPQADQLGVAIGGVLWEAAPRRGRSDDEFGSLAETPSRGPTVVVTRDGTPASPDLSCGLVRGLRRMGCHVVDAGVASGPTSAFAVYHLRADAGVHVTGAGGPRGASGCDLIDSTGVPWSRPGRLDRVRELYQSPAGRPQRRGGGFQSLEILASTRVECQRHFLGLRQLRIGVATECAVQRRMLEEWSADWPLSLVAVDGLPDIGCGAEPDRAARRALRSLQQEAELEWLVRIGPDGRQVELIDERSRWMEPAAWALRLMESSAAATRRCVVGAAFPPLLRGRLKALGCEVHVAEATHESIVRRMQETDSPLAADGLGRVWFDDHYPVCDGLATIARLARLAAGGQQPVSSWAA